MFLYVIVNTSNGKRYIGVTTVSVATRWEQHVAAARGGKTTPLHRAIKKYGAEVFVVEEIISLLPGFGADELFALERQLIAQEGTQIPGGYNVAPGGEGLTREGYPDSVRAKLSQAGRGRSPANKGKKADAATRQKLREAWTPERQALSDAALEKAALASRSEEANQKRRAVWTPEKRAAHRARNLERIAAEKAAGTFKKGFGVPWGPERRAAQCGRLKGHIHSDEMRAKLSASWTPERRAKVAARAAAIREAKALSPQELN